jgi:hypothetical protein
MTSSSLRWAAVLSLTLAPSLALAQAAPPRPAAARVLAAPTAPLPVPDMSATNAIMPPSPDPRVGLQPVRRDSVTGKVNPASEAIWNLRHLSNTPPSQGHNSTKSDLAFKGNFVFQGTYNGFQVWDISNPAAPVLKANPICPASQDDISVHGNLLFLSSEAPSGRLDCGTGGAAGPVSKERMRGVRIFDISDVAHPALITQVQTCRGSHTHTLLTDPNDKANIYVYISGSSSIRPAAEMAGCNANPVDPKTSHFGIEIIRVPLANPASARIVNNARIFAQGTTLYALPRGPSHGASPADAAGRGARGAAPGAAPAGAARGGRGGGGAGADVAPPAPPAPLIALYVRPGPQGKPPLVHEITAAPGDSASFRTRGDSLTRAGWTAVAGAGGGGRGGRGGGGGGGGRGGAGAAAAPVDSLARKGRAAMALVRPLNPTVKGDSARYIKTTDSLRAMGLDIPFMPAPRALTQCHDITVYPGVGYAGGACEGMGLLLDIRNPANPIRLDAYADTNFSYWHSATFSNDGSKVLFSDEWGGGGGAYCRADDPKEWGADALFSIEKGKLVHKSYYKMPAPQTGSENCVAHNGNLIPIPGRDIMVQAFYQGGMTVFEWTDVAKPKEIAFFDRGPGSGGYWSTYWYNGYLIGSHMSLGLDIFELTPSAFISQNEIDAAKLVKHEWMNPQDQPKFVWPANIVVVRSYLDQLVRWNGIAADRSTAISADLDAAMKVAGAARKAALLKVAVAMDADAKTAKDGARVKVMAQATRDLAATVK